VIGAAAVNRRPDGIDISHWFPVSRERVFAALSDVDQLMAWWGPPDYPVVECTVDFRPGGVWHYLLRGVNTGREVWARSVYREIEPPERIVYSETSSDAEGRVNDDRPAATVAILLATEREGTTLTAKVRHQSPLDRDRAIALGIESGFTRALDTLDHLLSSTKSGASRVGRSPDQKGRSHAERHLR
jgi:uncharacterized protein YndB with AHSA1/START domain